MIRVNLKTVYLCSRAAIPVMIANGRGSIVNMASIAATRACSGASYAAAKAGMLGYTRRSHPSSRAAAFASTACHPASCARR